MFSKVPVTPEDLKYYEQRLFRQTNAPIQSQRTRNSPIQDMYLQVRKNNTQAAKSSSVVDNDYEERLTKLEKVVELILDRLDLKVSTKSKEDEEPSPSQKRIDNIEDKIRFVRESKFKSSDESEDEEENDIINASMFAELSEPQAQTRGSSKRFTGKVNKFKFIPA